MKIANSGAHAQALARKRESQLYAAILELRSVEECRAFFADLCTPAEIEAMRDRWEVAKLLATGEAYRQIAERTGVSLTTISRVARCLQAGQSGYRRILERIGRRPESRVTDGRNNTRKSG